jgi:prepilin-type N-terminal cleavage/methylation domain-containing protein
MLMATTPRTRDDWDQRGRRAAGFTLIEIMFSVAVIGIMAAVSVPMLQNTIRDARASAAMRVLMGQFAAAREAAMTSRRNVEVKFLGTNQVQLVRIDSGTTSTTLSTVALENGLEYRTFTGMPDTPDQFGNAAAVSFGGATRIFFTTDGSLIDINAAPATGSVFLGVANMSITARAVTIMGTTGRIQGYRWDGRQWAQ